MIGVKSNICLQNIVEWKHKEGRQFKYSGKVQVPQNCTEVQDLKIKNVLHVKFNKDCFH